MSTAERLIQKGVEQVVINMLREGISAEIILKTAEITPEDLTRIQAKLAGEQQP